MNFDVIWGNRAVSTADLTWIITSPFITEPYFGSGDRGFSIAGNWDCWLSESKFRTLVKHWVVVAWRESWGDRAVSKAGLTCKIAPSIFLEQQKD